MGHWMLLIAIITAIDTIWCERVAGGHRNWTSSGHLRRCITADMHVQRLRSAIYLLISSVTNQNGLLQALDCDNHSDRYDMMLLSGACGHSKLDLIRSPTTL